MSPLGRQSKSGEDAWWRDANEQLDRACRELAAAARQARAAKGTGDNELAILGEEVIDLATRALVLGQRVAAQAAQPETESSSGEAGSEREGEPKTLMLSLRAAETSKWPASGIARLQTAVAPLTRAADILSKHTKESVDDVTLLREETMDVAARLTAAQARVEVPAE